MNAGERDKYISIQRIAYANDQYGGADNTQSELTKVWAHRRRKSMKEIQSGSDSQVNIDVWEMDATDITHDDLIVYNGIEFRVIGVDPQPFTYLVKTISSQ